MKRITVAVGLLLVLSLALVGCRSTKNQMIALPQEYPSKYAPWPSEDNNVADSVIFNKPVDISQYDKITVLPADFSNTVIEYDDEKDAKKRKPGTTWNNATDKDKVDQVRAFSHEFNKVWFDKISDKADDLPLGLVHGTDATSGLLLKTIIVISDPGSQSLRFLIGFGSGAARLRITVDLVDAKTQETLIEMTTEKVDIFSGESVGLLNDCAENIAEDSLVPLLKTLIRKPKS